MREHYDDRIVAISARLVTPFIQLFALYVIFHGHYSPGGGFQGGAMLAASFLLIRLSIGTDAAQVQFRRGWGTPGSSIGTFIFLGTGLAALILGVNFLDYAGLPLGLDPSGVRSMGILIVEIGVAVAVAATLTAIYDDLVGEEPERHHEGLEEEAAGTEESDQAGPRRSPGGEPSAGGGERGSGHA
ncbi:MAG: MnhB domain-containing protein [bacterium]